MKIRRAFALTGLAAVVFGAAAVPNELSAEGSADVDIPYTKFVLDNGLTLVVHEDHKAPIVAVNVWYHVGSKNERAGKTGFAHLFEHLMFNGTENYDDDYFGPFDRVGATDMNGTTNADRTNYFQNVPTPALDMALWMESDRMGHLLGALSQERLDEQRGVVQNEKRQRENQPYGRVFNHIVENTYPQGHPYSWSTIGSMEDLDAASLEDVKEWFKTYYGPANATIAIAGDITPEEALEKVEAHFGDIPSGPPVTRQREWIAPRTGSHREVMQDRVPQARVIKVWNVPGIGTTDGNLLDLASTALGLGKNSRLFERLVYEDQIASDATAFVWLREMGGSFVVWATALPGRDLAEVEAALDEEMQRFLENGPTKKELERIKMEHRAAFIRGIERIGGFGGKSDILASSQVYDGSPDAYKRNLAEIAGASSKDIMRAARKWLSDGAYVLEVHPFPEHAARNEGVDRSAVPDGGEPPEIEFPKFERRTLSSGLEVIVAERHAVPVVDFQLLVDAGYAADQGAALGTATLALDMLDEGTESRSSLEIAESLALVGASLSTESNLDISSVSLSALSENLDDALEIFADVVLSPRFADDEFKRLQEQQIAAIQREKVTPRSMALRVFPSLVYGDGHAYGIPFTGSGTESAVAGLTPADLRTFHDRWFVPNNASLVVVGDTTADEIVPKLEALFKDWEAGESPKKNLATVPLRGESTVYLLDRPGSLQSIIVAGHLAPPQSNPKEAAIEVMNEVLGGSFSSRINMNLREDKHWAYGAYSFFVGARGQRPFMAYAPVQTDKTDLAMAEILAELEGIVGPNPPRAEELARAKDKKTLTLPGRWETGAAVAKSISEIERFGFPDDHWAQLPREMRALDLESVAAAARETVHPDRLVWVVVGDREKIEAGIRALELGPIHLLDANGKPLNQDSPPAD